MSDAPFEHAGGFEQGELSGNVRLGKFEAHYEELFAEALEDGVITSEERAHLERAADSLGLDLIVFYTGDRCSRLRKQLGVSS